MDAYEKWGFGDDGLEKRKCVECAYLFFKCTITKSQFFTGVHGASTGASAGASAGATTGLGTGKGREVDPAGLPTSPKQWFLRYEMDFGHQGGVGWGVRWSVDWGVDWSGIVFP